MVGYDKNMEFFIVDRVMFLIWLIIKNDVSLINDDLYILSGCVT